MPPLMHIHGATYSGIGGPEVIVFRDDIPQPHMSDDDVLIDVAFAGLNRADVQERQGRYPVPPSPIAIPGMEYSGIVSAVGKRVTTRAVGDRVCGLVPTGAQAAQIATHALATARIPESVSLRDAAAIPEAFITAHDALFTRGGFTIGERALVHAVGSSVGLAAVALIKRAGGFAFGTSRTQTKLDRAVDLGLDGAFLLENGWVPKVRAATGGVGIDVVLDFVATGMFDPNIGALAQRGRIVQIGTMGGMQASFNVAGFLAKRAALHGTVLRFRPIDEKIALAKHLETALLPLFATGQLQANVDATFPLAELREAHDYMERDANFGKIVLSVSA